MTELDTEGRLAAMLLDMISAPPLHPAGARAGIPVWMLSTARELFEELYGERVDWRAFKADQDAKRKAAGDRIAAERRAAAELEQADQ